jgi:branched-subunit amino acid aminotransferase/4-amino-4-deoxychorismate lyase
VACADDAAPLAVMDSWLVEDDRARGLGLHRERFERAVAVATPALAGEVPEFWSAVLRAVPTLGRWFPRVELTAAPAPELRLRLRPAPETETEARVWIDTEPDRRTTPRVKGPDLELLMQLRAEAIAHGATDALLVDGSGQVLEGATASLLWWEDEVLCALPDDAPALAGVTSALVRLVAAGLGVSVEARRRSPVELDGLEVWCVNALHGIRPVTAWLAAPCALRGGPITPGAPRRARAWTALLEACREPVPR